LRPPLQDSVPWRLSRRGFVSGTLAAGLALGSAARGRAAALAAEPHILRVTKSGYDGKVPGPELRVKRGEEFAVRIVNELDEPTAVHWHGVRLPNAMDGAPPLTQAPIAPGASFDYRFVAPDAGTFWYHPPFSNGAPFYGVLVVDEAARADADHDATLTVGVDAPFFKINTNPNERMRLRFLNAGRQILQLRVADVPVFVMATDGQPAQPFAAREGRLTLGPGNRIDVFADCTLAPGSAAAISIEFGDRASNRIGTLACETTDAPARAARRDDPKALPSNPLPERMDFRDALRQEAAIGQSRTDKTDRPLFAVKRGRTVMLGLSGPTSANGFIHLHGHSFRLLDALDDGWKPFWLDTMPMAPRGKARIAFVADNPGKWLIEGLDGQNAWFEVT
jgi:FtsP/CotA-like multicopper oxidase with cupredoxin domain